VAGHLNSVKALAERVPAKNLIHPETMQSEDTIEGTLGQHALEYAQHSALWEFFASFDRWEEFALQYMNAAHSHRDRLAERQYKNETKAALEEFMQRAKSMVLGDDGLNAVLDDVGKGDDKETHVALGRIRDLYVPEIVLRMHEVFVWGGENLDAAYPSLETRKLIICRYLEEAFDLAAAVADSGAKLYECFRATNQLEDYLTKLKELSIISLKPENLGTGIGTGLTT
jgi:Nuclear pore protein 84 / 107